MRKIRGSVAKTHFCGEISKECPEHQAPTAHEDAVFDFLQQNRTASHGAIPLVRALNGQDYKV
jgi:hypothetical protein